MASIIIKNIFLILLILGIYSAIDPSIYLTISPTKEHITYIPQSIPTDQPSNTCNPTKSPRVLTSETPSVNPTILRSAKLSLSPIRNPTTHQTYLPYLKSSKHPSNSPSGKPTNHPSKSPSRKPSNHPSYYPSKTLSKHPTFNPSVKPSPKSSIRPSRSPSRPPSIKPSRFPSQKPSRFPSQKPSFHPSRSPSRPPSLSPSIRSSPKPSRHPSLKSSRTPSRSPSRPPSRSPSRRPTFCSSSRLPTTFQPSTTNPSLDPTFKPTTIKPSLQPTTSYPTSKPLAPFSGFGFYSTSGNQIIDAFGNPVRIIGINWYGFETSRFVPGGLHVRSYKSILQQIKSVGFNAIRIPFSNQMLSVTSTYIARINYGVNPDLSNLTPLQVMDKIIGYAGSIGLRVVLDRHSAKASNFVNECQVYISGDPTYTLDRYISDWVMLANRYANSAVIAADLWNEPHQTAGEQCATWGSGNIDTDYDYIMAIVGNAILEANPDWLIIIEGFYGCSVTELIGVWWGSDLSCVAFYPITLSDMTKLVYSTHEYSADVGQLVDGVWNTVPWFNDPSFPYNMPDVWYDRWGYLFLNNMFPILVGEWGFRLNNPLNPDFEATKIPWIKGFIAYMNGYFGLTDDNSLPADSLGMSTFFWALNPSTDVQGFFLDDWVTINPSTIQNIQSLLIGTKLLK